MSQNTTLDKIVASLTASLARTRTLAEAEALVGGFAAVGLMAAVETALHDLAEVRMEQLRDELHAALPPICGGAPDFEEIDAAIFDQSWPAYPDPEVDGYRYETGPTPLSVLADSDPSAEWELTPSQWDALESRWTDADQLAAFGHV